MTEFRPGSRPASCDAAAEYISALCDGETIPCEVAQHLGECEICKTRLEDYLRMGVELKRMASASAPENVAPISWERARRANFNEWQIWRQTMRIPRVAFALMIVVITVLSLRVATVRATGQQWFVVHVWGKDGKPSGRLTSGFKPGGPSPKGGLFFRVPEGSLGVSVVLLKESEGIETLGIQAVLFPPDADRSKETEQLHSAPVKEVTCSPGEKVPISVVGYGSIEISAEISDKEPEGLVTSKLLLFPEDGHLSLTGTTALIRDDQLVGKVDMQMQFAAKDMYFAFHAPDEGWYAFSTQPFPGSVEGSVSFNHVDFALDGQKYTLITGSPIRGSHDPKKIWIAYNSHFGLIKTLFGTEKECSMNFGKLNDLEAGLEKFKN